jgi:glycosyltransferase involved in cell wall biosynthesis
MNPLPCRVVLVTHYFSTHRGGVENAAGQLAERLVEDGSFQVTWFASDCDLPPATRVGLSMAPMRSWNGIERLGLPWPIWGVGSLRRLKCAIAAADIVHLHDFIYFGNLAAFLFAKWRKTPILVTQHIGDIPYRSRLLSGILKLINRSIGRFVLSKADQVVFISDVVRKQFLRSVSFRTEPLFWPNGVDTHVFFPVDDASRNALRETLPGSPKTTVCLFVGRFVEKKGLGILRQLAREFQDVEWWFAGWDLAPAQRQSICRSLWRKPCRALPCGRPAGLAEQGRRIPVGRPGIDGMRDACHGLVSNGLRDSRCQAILARRYTRGRCRRCSSMGPGIA